MILSRRVSNSVCVHTARIGGPLGRRGAHASAQDHNYCADLVRKHDYDNYLASLFLPAPVRRAVLSARALNVEAATAREQTKEAQLAKIRLQWWKDVLAQCAQGKPPKQPIAVCLADAMSELKVSKMWLTRLLDERAKQIDDRPFPSLEGLELYAENTAASLLYFTLEGLGVRDVNADHVASHVGKAAGTVTILRGTAFQASRKKLLLPITVMAKHGVSQEAVVRGEGREGLQEVSYEVASAAHSHLAAAKEMSKGLPKGAFNAFLPVVSIEDYLSRLQKEHFDVFSPNLLRRNPNMALKYVWASWKKEL